MAIEKPWEDFADQATIADTDSLLVRTAAGAGAEVPGAAIVKNDAYGNQRLSGGYVHNDGGYFGIGAAFYSGAWRNTTAGQGGGAIRNNAGVMQFMIGSNPGAAGSVITDMLEVARITPSREFLVGTTSSVGLYSGGTWRPGVALDPGGAVLAQKNDGECAWFAKASGYSNAGFVGFAVNGTGVGSISTTGTATSYNTSSDYRLKTDRKPVENALARLLNVPVWNFAWQATGARTDGFYAHELAEVVPCAVTGEKDEMQLVDVVVEPERVSDVLGPDGKPIAVPAVIEKQMQPKYQGIDQAKLVPLLTAAVQELAGMVEQMRAELDQLRSDGK